jgi:hypothetical protein
MEFDVVRMSARFLTRSEPLDDEYGYDLEIVGNDGEGSFEVVKTQE